MDAQSLVKNILKAQNAKLLEDIGKRYNFDVNELKTKYLTPTFFSVDIKPTK